MLTNLIYNKPPVKTDGVYYLYFSYTNMIDRFSLVAIHVFAVFGVEGAFSTCRTDFHAFRIVNLPNDYMSNLDYGKRYLKNKKGIQYL